MIVLGIDTATSVCSVGVAGAEGLLADYRINRGYIHGEYLTVAIREVLKGCSIALEEVDGFAVSIGPGSFTGLRIGLGVIKGIVLGKKRPVAAVPTMDGLVYRIPPVIKQGCVLMRARKGEIYKGLYQYSRGKWERKGNYVVINEKDIGQHLGEEKMFFIGNGVEKVTTLINQRVRDPVFFSPDHSLPSGFSIARLGWDMIKQNHIADIEKLVPLYIKSFKGIM